MIALLWLINQILSLYIWAFILSAIMSWLLFFNVINSYNRFVLIFGKFLYTITEPLLRPIRNLLPNMGGVDLSPVLAILLISFVRILINEYWPL